VHNANYADDAVCYLRYSGKNFVKWVTGDKAVNLAEELVKSCAVVDNEGSVFHGTKDFDLEEHKEFLTKLATQIRRRFPMELIDETEAICFGLKAKRRGALG
jgi:hypothetical protein